MTAAAILLALSVCFGAWCLLSTDEPVLLCGVALIMLACAMILAAAAFVQVGA